MVNPKHFLCYYPLHSGRLCQNQNSYQTNQMQQEKSKIICCHGQVQGWCTKAFRGHRGKAMGGTECSPEKVWKALRRQEEDESCLHLGIVHSDSLLLTKVQKSNAESYPQSLVMSNSQIWLISLACLLRHHLRSRRPIQGNLGRE